MFVGLTVPIKRSAKNEHKVIFLLTRTLNRAIMEAEESGVKCGEIPKHISDLVPEEEEARKVERRVRSGIQKLSS
jgi:F420-0:gamma-glutamyl ligase-like protein